MTMLQRIMRVVKSNNGRGQGLSSYYNNLLESSVGDSGMPTATEARRDLEAVMRKPTYF